MESKLILEMVDASYKECEVTGRDLGGKNLYEIPLSSLKAGFVNWAQDKTPDHSIEIKEIGEDFVVARIYNVASHPNSWKTIRAGESISIDYEFGEWSYSCTLKLKAQ